MIDASKLTPSRRNLARARAIAAAVTEEQLQRFAPQLTSLDANDLTAIFARELEWIDATIMREEFAPLKSEQLIPYHPAGGPGVDLVTYRKITELGQAVGPRAGVLAAVVAVPGLRVGEPEVGPAVDHHGLVGQLPGDLRGLTVRQAQEHHVVAGQDPDRGLLEDPVGQRQQVRLEGAQRLAGVAARRQRADLHVRVGEEQAEQLAAGVPAGAGDGDPDLRHAA